MKHTPERLRAAYARRPPTPEEVSLAIGIAKNTAARWPRHHCEGGIDHDDLVAETMAAAWRALLTYEPGRGVRLVTWLVANCRGAVLEALRQADLLTRLERGRYNEELAANPNAPPPRILVSLDYILEEDQSPGENNWMIRFRAALSREDEGIRSLPDRVDAVRLAHRALSALDDTHAEVIRHCVMGDRSFKEHAKRINRSESRVHQLRDESLVKMRRVVEAIR